MWACGAGPRIAGEALTMWTAQVGGKYHPHDDTVFRLKRLLSHLDVSVSHPIADEITVSAGDQGFAFDPAEMTFSEVEQDYYNSIKVSDFHVVANQFRAHLGYLGGSASLEIAYAMCQHRAIVLLHPASINVTVDDAVRAFLLPRLHRVVIHNFLTASRESSIALMATIGGCSVDYGASSQDKVFIESRVRILLNGLQVEKGNVAS